MLIMILFHSSGYRCLKHFYLNEECGNMKDEFKLHLFCNERGEPLSFAFTKGNIDDRKPLGDKQFIKDYWCPLNFKRHDKTLRNASKHGVADSFFKTKPPPNQITRA